jgi:hypothetical protein
MSSKTVLKRHTMPVILGAAALALAHLNIAAAAPKTTASYSNNTLTVYGQPASTVGVGEKYVFKPQVNRYSRKLRFSVTNKPSWLSFASSDGTLYGVPRGSNVGTYKNITISVTDGRRTATLAPFAITVTDTSTSPTPTPTPTNTPPTISGTPVTVINSGQTYSFKPSALDANGDPLNFSISGKPSWAAFNTATGALTGTPAYANAGTYSNIVISVSDGQATTSLSAFSLTVNQVASGRATVSWTPPITNTDGSALTNLAGYRVTYGTSASALTTTATVSNPSLSNTLIEDLAPGTWYFAVKAYTSTGTESEISTTVAKTIQ